ncbi:MAG: PQQ-dependent sugar dehydrogenase [Phycisphaerae bacterium]
MHIRAVFASAVLLPAAFAVGQLGTDLVVGGLSNPLFLAAPEGDDRLFVLERGGNVRVIDADGNLLPTPFLSLSPGTAGEGGLLGLAFHPNYATNGRFFVNYTNATVTQTIVEEYTVSGTNPNVADAASARTVITYAQPGTNHNAGWIGFSPNDGYLYIPTGDGGGSNDPSNNAQTFNNLLGKVLRLDVDGDDFPADAARNYAIPAGNPYVGDPSRPDEIVAYGLRNPYRNSFDRLTGDLYLGDVGQNTREEISLLRDGDFAPGDVPNFGWRAREGYAATPTGPGGGVGGPRPAGNVDPILDYPHAGPDTLGRSIVGGYVYRGSLLGPAFQGKYLFGDFISGRYFTADTADLAGITDFTDLSGLNLALTDVTAELFPGGAVRPFSFGEDADGELYVLGLDGGVYAVVPEPTTLMAFAFGALAMRRRRG